MKNEGLVKLRILVLMAIFQNVFSPKAAGWTQESFWKHPSKTNIPDIRSTNPDKSLIGKMKPGWEALEFQDGFEYVGFVYYF